MALFDAFVFVDWSAASGPQPQKPVADAVWVGEHVPAQDFQSECYHRTRNAGVAHVTSAVQNHIREGRRVLVGFDFPYGFPAGLADGLALPAGPQAWWSLWAELADRLHDTPDNVNNRFVAAGDLNGILRNGQSGPFWGCPVSAASASLEARSPGFPIICAGAIRLARLRLVEARLPGTQETWKLYGAGSVGGQALVGIPYVYRLRRNLELARLSRVWPFETGFTTTPCPSQGPYVLHAEIWPGVVERRVRELVHISPELIRDRAQVRAMCQWAAECDEEGTLGGFFDWPAELSEHQAQACLEQEGWILGAA